MLLIPYWTKVVDCAVQFFGQIPWNSRVGVYLPKTIIVHGCSISPGCDFESMSECDLI